MTLSNLIYGTAIFNPKNPYHRAIRRAVIIAILAFVAEAIKGIVPIAPEYAVPLIVATTAGIEKYLRDIL